MTSIDIFDKIIVGKGDHYCMFCAQKADFVIADNNVNRKKEYPMCSTCATLLKKRINIGIVFIADL